MTDREELYRSMENLLKAAEENLKQSQNLSSEVSEKVRTSTQDWENIHKRTRRIIYAIFSVMFTILAFLGVKNLPDLIKHLSGIKQEYQVVKTLANEVRANHNIIETVRIEAEHNIEDLKKNIENTTALRQITLDIHRLAREIKLYDEVEETKEELEDIFINMIFFEKEVFEKYILNYYHYDYAVIYEAAKVYMELKKQGYYRTIPVKKKSAIIKSLVYCLQKCPDEEWRFQRKARILIQAIFDTETDPEWRRVNSKVLHLSLLEDGSDKFKWNVAIVLSEIGSRSDEVKKILAENAENNKNGWIESLSVIGLLKLGHPQGWKLATQTMQKGRMHAFALSLFLGGIDRDRLKQLGIDNLNVGDTEDKLNYIADLLENKRKTGYLDNYSDKYIGQLIGNLRGNGR